MARGRARGGGRVRRFLEVRNGSILRGVKLRTFMSRTRKSKRPGSSARIAIWTGQWWYIFDRLTSRTLEDGLCHIPVRS